MTASYRLIHFNPDPFTGARFALGAVVASIGGEVRVAKAEKLPSAACLGDPGLAIAVQRLHARLDAVESAERLPSAFGPYATLAEPREVPAGVKDPLSWVRDLLAARPNPAARQVTRRGVNRGTRGYRFFETWAVAHHVRKTFKPATDWNGWLGKHAAGLQQVTHWVSGEESVLLMEPIVADRRQFRHDLTDIASKFMAYRYALESAENGRAGQLVAYVTGGGHPDLRAEAAETLEPFAHLIVDTTDDAARAGFLARIRQVGAEGQSQQELGAGRAEGTGRPT